MLSMLYPFKLDLTRDRVLQIDMDEAAFRTASFLDDRILAPAAKGGWTSLSTMLESGVVQATGLPIHFIFHTGHVGSTLLSRLLDEIGGVLPLREPLPLRTLADAQDALGDASGTAIPPLGNDRFSSILALFLGLWRRGFASTQMVIVKATSSAARLAPALLDAAPQARAIYLNLHAEPYLANLLAGENSPVDLIGHASERLRRFAAQRHPCLPIPGSLSIGELAALSWLVETTTQRAVLARFPGRVLAMDFDALLADLPGQLQRVLVHIGLPNRQANLSQVLQSPVLGRYSKAPEQPFDPALRAALLLESRARNRGEILKGLRFLEKMAIRPATG